VIVSGFHLKSTHDLPPGVCTMREVAEALGISHQRVAQLLVSAVRKLRKSSRKEKLREHLRFSSRMANEFSEFDAKRYTVPNELRKENR
jgi:hypothetical protein